MLRTREFLVRWHGQKVQKVRKSHLAHLLHLLHLLRSALRE